MFASYNMTKRFEYTMLAQRYTAQYPVLSFVGIETSFWIVANFLLVCVMHLTSQMISETFMVPVTGRFAPLVWIAVTLGISYGVILGLINYYLDQKIFRKLALGKVIVLKTVTSLSALFLILTVLRYVFLDLLILPSLPSDAVIDRDRSWNSIFRLLAIYYFFMTLLISFINQVNKKFGPGVLLPLLLGRYRDPKEEERVFMFMDLKSSTTAAEQLGHLTYSAFIRDCFSDINEVLNGYRAQVYQYAGDEIIVTWPENEGIKNHFCIAFYFACLKKFQDRAEYYKSHYSILPSFKAGVHTGIVTTVEIGDIKRDLAYHGDTINTAARIRSACNDYNKNLIVSKALLDKVGVPSDLQIEQLGSILLKGKTTEVELFSLDYKSGIQ